MHLPYTLEGPLLPPLLRHPVFEPATPAQLAAMSALWGNDSGTVTSPAAQLSTAASNATAGVTDAGMKRSVNLRAAGVDGRLSAGDCTSNTH